MFAAHVTAHSTQVEVELPGLAGPAGAISCSPAVEGSDGKGSLAEAVLIPSSQVQSPHVRMIPTLTCAGLCLWRRWIPMRFSCVYYSNLHGSSIKVALLAHLDHAASPFIQQKVIDHNHNHVP